jgi:hypothetical protein
MWLEARADRRGAGFAAAHGILSRADVVPPAVARVPLPESERPSIAPQVVNFNFYGADATRESALIREAIRGTVVGLALPHRGRPVHQFVHRKDHHGSRNAY